MSYIVQASTLTKIFLPEWHDRCLRDPKILAVSEPFAVQIPRSAGAINLVHNVPVVASSLIKRTQERKIEDDEVAPLVRWLTEENEAETDIYGVVAVNIENNIADAIMALIHDVDGEEKQAKLLREIKIKMAKDIHEARKRADARVMRQCGKMYSTVRETVQLLKQQGSGVYSPSYSEALALDILSDQIALRRAPDARAEEMMSKAMSKFDGVPTPRAPVEEQPSA